MRYRYILNGSVKPNDNISNYRLLDRQKLSGFDDAIRIEIPDDTVLEKCNCDEYSTWHHSNKKNYQLKELNPRICLKVNGKWQVIEQATMDWLIGKDKNDCIKDEIKDKLHPIPLYNIGYITNKQWNWYHDNLKYGWRFDKLPDDLENVEIPILTESQLDTLSFVRREFLNYYEELIENNYHFKDNEKEEAKEFFKNWIKNVSDDELAFRWHIYSTTSLDPNKKFETVVLINKIKRSKYNYVYDDHYKYAIKHIIEDKAMDFRFYLKYKQIEDDYERD